MDIIHMYLNMLALHAHSHAEALARCSNTREPHKYNSVCQQFRK